MWVHGACVDSRNLEVVSYLLENKADVNARKEK